MAFRKYALRAAVLCAAFGIGYFFRGVSRTQDSSGESRVRSEERAASSSARDNENGMGQAVHLPSLETNREGALVETIKVLQDNQKSLEEKVLEYKAENKKLGEELSGLKRMAGVYDFSSLKEPEGNTLEEKFGKNSEYYLGNINREYENLLSMIDFAVKIQKNIREKGIVLNDPGAKMDFYDFGEMTVHKDADREAQYFIDVNIKDELLKEPFKSDPDSYNIPEIMLRIDKARIEGNDAKEIFSIYFIGQVHTVDVYYDTANMVWSEHITFTKLGSPVSTIENKKIRTKPKSVILSESIIQDVDFVLRDIIVLSK